MRSIAPFGAGLLLALPLSATPAQVRVRAEAPAAPEAPRPVRVVEVPQAPPPESAPRRAEGRGMIGVYLGDPSGDAVVTALVPGGAAEAAELRVGDRILSLDGEPMDDARAVVDAVSERRAGDRVELVVERDGWRKRFELALGAAQDAPAPRGAVEDHDEAVPFEVFEEAEAVEEPEREGRLEVRVERSLGDPHVERRVYWNGEELPPEEWDRLREHESWNIVEEKLPTIGRWFAAPEGGERARERDARCGDECDGCAGCSDACGSCGRPFARGGEPRARRDGADGAPRWRVRIEGPDGVRELEGEDLRRLRRRLAGPEGGRLDVRGSESERPRRGRVEGAEPELLELRRLIERREGLRRDERNERAERIRRELEELHRTRAEHVERMHRELEGLHRDRDEHLERIHREFEELHERDEEQQEHAQEELEELHEVVHDLRSELQELRAELERLRDRR